MTTPSPDARFRQTTPAPRAVRLVAVVMAALGLAVWGLSSVAGIWSPGSIAGLLLVAGGFAVDALRIRITLDPDEVVVALVPYRRIRIPYSAIADCAVVDHLRPRTVGGIGVRALPGGGAAILLDAGPAIRIESADGTRHLVRSTFPREAATRIRDRAAAAPLAPPVADDPEDPAAATA